jgi:hypothetical protein
MQYKLRDKRKRNKEVYQYYLDNQKNELTYKEIGEHFELTGARVFEIIRKEKIQ